MLIYKITNNFDNKVYIGKTIRTMKQRFMEHCKPCTDGVLARAIRKHGKENFKIEMIAWATNITELNYLEFILIHKHDSLVPKGYNILPGATHSGSGKKSQDACDKISRNMVEWHKNNICSASQAVVDIVTKETWVSATEAAKDNGINRITLMAKLNGRKGNETNLRYVGMEDVCKPWAAPHRAVVDIVTKQFWSTMTQAAKDNGNIQGLSCKLLGRKGNETNLRYVGMEDVCKKGRPVKKVINTETGEIYKSGTNCAKTHGFYRKTFIAKLSGKRHNNTPFRYL